MKKSLGFSTFIKHFVENKQTKFFSQINFDCLFKFWMNQVALDLCLKKWIMYQVLFSFITSKFAFVHYIKRDLLVFKRT